MGIMGLGAAAKGTHGRLDNNSPGAPSSEAPGLEVPNLNGTSHSVLERRTGIGFLMHCKSADAKIA